VARCGPTDNSAKVIALIDTASGSDDGSVRRPNKITVEVSSSNPMIN
jgi:hypothetical protein